MAKLEMWIYILQAIFDLETNNKDMGNELKDLFINFAS